MGGFRGRSRFGSGSGGGKKIRQLPKRTLGTPDMASVDSWETERRQNAETEENCARVLAQFGVAEVLDLASVGNGPHDFQVACLQCE